MKVMCPTCGEKVESQRLGLRLALTWITALIAAKVLKRVQSKR